MVNSKQKGNRGERELAKLLQEKYPGARRGQQFSGSPDSPDVIAIPGVHIECKYLASGLNCYNAIEQAIEDSGEDDIPAVFYRKVSKQDKGKPWLVLLELPHFLKLLERAGLSSVAELATGQRL